MCVGSLQTASYCKSFMLVPNLINISGSAILRCPCQGLSGGFASDSLCVNTGLALVLLLFNEVKPCFPRQDKVVFKGVC